MFDKYKNKDGTYNGISMLTELSGLSRSELKWTADRLKQLMTVEGKSKEVALNILKEERKILKGNDAIVEIQTMFDVENEV